jgi:dihydrofolate reductase
MRYRFLFNFLKLAAASKGIKKINLFLNFAIFLSIFAITSTLISIYYESKITSLERKITKNEITLDILSVSTLAIPGKVLSLENVADDIKKNNDVINYFYFTKVGSIYDDYERYYRPVMSIAEYLNSNFEHIKAFNEVTSMKDQEFLKGVNENIKKNLNQNLENQKKFLFIKKKINDEHDKHIKVEKGVEVISGSNKFYKSFEEYYDQFILFIDDQLIHYAKITGVLQTIFNNIKNQNLELTKEISKNSKESKKFILFAFSFQLIIFIIIQAMEIITTRREIENLK